MKLENKSTCWPFNIDKTENWAYYNNIFSKEECEKIIFIGNKLKLEKAKISNNNKTNFKIRKSSVSWIYPNKETNWIFQKITDVIFYLNTEFFKFDLFGFIEGLQFTYYKEPDGKYERHIDKSLNNFIRKLSVTIQLSDPSTYSNGDLLLYFDDKPNFLPKEQGKLIAFPSYVLHEVKPVTKGERYSLVAWITGPQFK